MATIVGGATGSIDVQKTVSQLIEVENTKRLDPLSAKIVRKQDAVAAISDLKALAADLEVKLSVFEDPAQFNGASPSAALSGAIKDLVASFNALNTKVRLYGRVNLSDPTRDTAKEVVLFGDSALQGLERVIREGLTGGLKLASTGETLNFSDLGVSRKLDGSVTFDPKALTKALSRPAPAIIAGLAAGGATSRFRTSLTSAALYNGPLQTRTDQLNGELYTLSKRFSDEQSKISGEQDRLLTKYAKLNAILGSLGSTSSFLTAQINSLSKSNN